MGDLSTYSLVDFFPLSPEVYFRLFVRQNAAVWPAQVPAVALGLAAIWLARRGRGRAVGAILGAVWVWVGYTFHLELYANLNWAATYAGWAFVLQGGLLVAYGLLGRLDRRPDEASAVPTAGAFGLAVFGIAVFPFIGPLSGHTWSGVQLFGVAPDPTVVATLGLALTAQRIPWLLLVVPLLWCVASGATGWVMGSPSALAAAGAGASALLLSVVGVFRDTT